MPAMMTWRVMYRVANRRAFDGCLARTLEVIPNAEVVEDGKPYWKDPVLWECRLQSPLESDVPAERVLESLLIAFGLARGWHVGGSLDPETGTGLNGVFSLKDGGNTPTVGLEWACFAVVDESRFEDEP